LSFLNIEYLFSHYLLLSILKYVYVADSKNNRIQQFDINGNFVKVIGHLGKKSGEFNLPTTIEMDSYLLGPMWLVGSSTLDNTTLDPILQ